MAALLLDVALGFIVLAVASAVMAQSSEPADPLDLYDENENGVIDGDEAIQAIEDHFAGRIDRDLASKVLKLYLDAAAPARGQSWPSECDEYDSNNDDVINKAEAIAALDNYFDGIITKHEFLEVLRCYLFPNPPTAPTGFTVRVDLDGPDGIVLSWAAPPGVITGYEVQRSMGSGSPSYSTIATPSGYVRVYRDTTVMEGTSYQYRVRARNSGGAGPWATSPRITFNFILRPWYVLGYRSMLIDWLIPLAERSSANQYKLVVSANTGFQINATTAPNGSKCNWQSPPSTDTEWVDLGTSFYLVRCKLGTGNADIVVKKILKSGTNRTESTVRTLEDISQSWHHADHHVSYKITSPLLGTRPSGAYQGYTTLSQRESDTGINNAASIWNHLDPLDPLWQGQTVPLTFDSVSASPDVTIQGYWNPADAQLPEKCDYHDAIACIRPGGVYPHFTHSKMWIKYPPRLSGQLSYVRWTNDIDDARRMPGTYYYLPETIMHECGHTAGLGHAEGRSYSIMGTKGFS